MLARMRQKRNPYMLVVGMQVCTTTMESSMETLKKLNIELPYDPVMLFLSIYPKECKTGFNRDTCAQMFFSALFTIAKINDVV
jgi:hypothetical protein